MPCRRSRRHSEIRSIPACSAAFPTRQSWDFINASRYWRSQAATARSRAEERGMLKSNELETDEPEGASSGAVAAPKIAHLSR